MKQLLNFLFVSIFVLSGCARMDKPVVYTEEGLRAAEQQWDEFYREKAEECRAQCPPKSECMEKCFGKVYDADIKVADALRSAVAVLRSYWVARAQGEHPDWSETVRQVVEILNDLPPQARKYFERVKGLP